MYFWIYFNQQFYKKSIKKNHKYKYCEAGRGYQLLYYVVIFVDIFKHITCAIVRLVDTLSGIQKHRDYGIRRRNHSWKHFIVMPEDWNLEPRQVFFFRAKNESFNILLIQFCWVTRFTRKDVTTHLFWSYSSSRRLCDDKIENFEYISTLNSRLSNSSKCISLTFYWGMLWSFLLNPSGALVREYRFRVNRCLPQQRRYG